LHLPTSTCLRSGRSCATSPPRSTCTGTARRPILRRSSSPPRPQAHRARWRPDYRKCAASRRP
jgi:hypothetical protein